MKILLNTACQYADSSTVKLLLSSSRSTSGANQRLICRQNRKGDTPYHLACSSKRTDLVEVLLNICSISSTTKALETKNRKGYTPLMAAIETGDTELVFHLLSWRSNIRIAEIMPTIYLTIAVMTKSFEMVSLLLDLLDSATCIDYSIALCTTLKSCDKCEDAIEIIKILIEAGADPFVSCTALLIPVDEQKSHTFTTALSIAIYKGQVNFVACILDTFFASHKTFQKQRRMDRVLQKQPDSYFHAKEQIEKKQIERAGQDAILSALLLFVEIGQPIWQNPLSMRRLGCALSTLRRGISFKRDGLVYLMKCAGINQEPYFEIIKNDCYSLQSCYTHDYDIDKRLSSNIYSRSYGNSWSQELMQIDWVWDDVSEGEINCPWISLQIKDRTRKYTATIERDDKCFLLCGENSLIAHKSILKRSSKLEAAIRFAEMTDDGSRGCTELKLDISFDLLRLFIQHCYHGSMVFGLSLNESICCQQLLDLNQLGQEYLCPSLSLECEMRLLSRDPFQCFCWNCCKKVENAQDICQFTCHYDIKGPSKLLNAGNLLIVASQLDEPNHLQNSYTIYLIDAEKRMVDMSFSPLKALSFMSWVSMLLNFMDVLKSDSYLSVYHSTLSEYSEKDRHSEDLECYGDKIGILLLQNCIDAFASFSQCKASV